MASPQRKRISYVVPLFIACFLVIRIANHMRTVDLLTALGCGAIFGASLTGLIRSWRGDGTPTS